jgi:prepilin-type N-terminal cleavage/methylation domain-containing protein
MRSQHAQRLLSRAGYSLIELVTAIGIFGILAAAGLPYVDTHRQDINSAASQVIADYRWARTSAITSGVHYTITWTGSGAYQVRRLKQNADTTWSLDKVTKQVSLPSTVLRTGSPDTIEFNTRGIVVGGTTMATQTLSSYGGSRAIAVWPSGQTDAYQ